jgi:hypothetical protein
LKAYMSRWAREKAAEIAQRESTILRYLAVRKLYRPSLPTRKFMCDIPFQTGFGQKRHEPWVRIRMMRRVHAGGRTSQSHGFEIENGMFNFSQKRNGSRVKSKTMERELTIPRRGYSSRSHGSSTEQDCHRSELR